MRPNRCTECSKIIRSENKSGLCSHCYKTGPKFKDYSKKYKQRPEVKARAREISRLRYIKKEDEQN